MGEDILHCQPGDKVGSAVPATQENMELENIVANTVLLKAREGKRRRRAGTGDKIDSSSLCTARTNSESGDSPRKSRP